MKITRNKNRVVSFSEVPHGGYFMLKGDLWRRTQGPVANSNGEGRNAFKVTSIGSHPLWIAHFDYDEGVEIIDKDNMEIIIKD